MFGIHRHVTKHNEQNSETPGVKWLNIIKMKMLFKNKEYKPVSNEQVLTFLVQAHTKLTINLYRELVVGVIGL